MEELSETARNEGQEVGVSHEIQTAFPNASQKAYCLNELDQFGSPRVVLFMGMTTF
jgi:hypothetical protein